MQYKKGPSFRRPFFFVHDENKIDSSSELFADTDETQYQRWRRIEPMRSYREYLRPWKLTTLATGLSLLILGSFYFEAPDWDIPISIIMALFAYLFAPWCIRVVLERRYRLWPVAAFWTWLSVDGCYAIYWYFKDPRALDLMRSANFFASLSLFGMCGLLWVYRGSVAEFWADVGALRRGRE